MGAGVLAMPLSLGNLGWVAGPIAIILFYLVSVLAARLLASVYEVDGVQHPRYFEAVRHILGASRCLPMVPSSEGGSPACWRSSARQPVPAVNDEVAARLCRTQPDACLQCMGSHAAISQCYCDCATCAAPRCAAGRRAEIAAAVCQLSNMFLVCIACEWLRQGCRFACSRQAVERWPWLQRGQWQQACLARPACWAHALRCIV